MCRLIICNRIIKAQNGQQITGRGNTPAKKSRNVSPEWATDCSATPSGFAYCIHFSRGVTPACNIISPSGFGSTIAYNHMKLYDCLILRVQYIKRNARARAKE